MNQNDRDQLARIYNTMTLISTKGQDTIYMAECLRALKNIYENIEIDLSNNNEEEE